MRNHRGTKVIITLCLFLLLAAVALALSPTGEFIVVEEETQRRVWCVVKPLWGEWTVRYLSRNSIYGALAEETWTVDATGVTIARVRSTPIVLEYYGIADYRRLADGTAEGAPVVSRYEVLRLKASPRGEQRLLAGSDELTISTQFAEGVVLIVQPRSASRFMPCATP